MRKREKDISKEISMRRNSMKKISIYNSHIATKLFGDATKWMAIRFCFVTSLMVIS